MSALFRAAWAARLTLAAILLSPTTLLAQEEAPPPVVVPKKDDGITVLARGPLHEAFAQATEAKPEPGMVVPKKPPAPVPEVPPDQKPKGNNVQWIPGYWAWDLEKKDFIWVSGVWRLPPPGRKWEPGHWHQAQDGWQWVSGFWASAQAPLRYLQEPPDSLDNGPSSPKPDEDSNYVPGTWVPRGNGFAWRPGYWNNNYSEWIWNPDGYYWTPGGYLHNPGYWDYNLEDRGLAFAPVFFNQPFWNNPGWSYTPSYCIGFPGLFGSLFYGPNNWFYFGNFYSPFFRAWGFRPWVFGGFGNRLWNHYAWRNRFNPGWANAQRNLAVARFNGRAPLPANTLAGQQARNSQFNSTNHLHMVTPLHQMGNQANLTRVSPNQVSQHRTAANQMQQHALNRGGHETAHMQSTGIGGRSPNLNGARPSYYRAPMTAMPRTAAGYYGGAMPGNRMPAYHQAPAYHHAAPGGYHHGGGHMSGGHHGGGHGGRR